MLLLEFAGRCRHEDALVNPLHHFFKTQWSVVSCRWESKSVIDKSIFPASVALILAVELRNGYMAFIDHEQKILREIIEQRERWLTWATTIYMHGIVLNPIAIAHLLDHFKVVLSAHPQPLGFQQLSLALKPGEAFLEFGFYARNRTS